MAKKFIVIPRAFLEKERDQVYGNPAMAFWRELLQNALDKEVGTTKIVINTADKGSFIDVRFSDNGCGMSRETLDNVYFKLGASTKDGTNSVGGFGRARILTCFSMRGYHIWTRNSKVVGTGARHETFDTEPVVGTTLRIKAVGKGFTLENMERQLHIYLKQCDIKGVEIVINGETWSYDYDIGKKIRNLEANGKVFAEAFYREGGDSYCRMVVRVNGISMFDRYAEAMGRITVQIDPEFSKEVLNANRDSLKETYREALDMFVQELSTETESALRVKHESYFKVFEGKGVMKAERREPVVKDPQDRERSKAVRVTPALAISALSQSIKGVISLGAEEHFEDDGVDYVVHEEIRAPRERTVSEFLPTIPIFVDSSTPVLLKAADSWDPHNWKFTIEGNSVKWQGCLDKLKTLLMFSIACDHAAQALIKSGKCGPFSYSCGFVFSDYAKAMNKTFRAKDGDGMTREAFAIMLNPVDEQNKPVFNLRDKMSLKKIMNRVKHEMTHVVRSGHDETFSAVREAIDDNFDEWKALNDMFSAR